MAPKSNPSKAIKKIVKKNFQKKKFFLLNEKSGRGKWKLRNRDVFWWSLYSARLLLKMQNGQFLDSFFQRKIGEKQK